MDEVALILAYEQIYLEPVNLTPRLSAAQLQPLSSEQRLTLLHESLLAAGLFPHNANLGQTRGIIAVAATNIATSYHPATFRRLPIHLVLADAAPEALQHALVTGWAAYGEVLVAHTPGTHRSIMYAPHVQHLAQTITNLLQEQEPAATA
jgi:thioesterase domain-containing protein